MAKTPPAGEKPPAPAPQLQPGGSPWQALLGVFLTVCNVAVRVYCGLYMIISDCDETYNYWEPLNLVFRGFGKQTWEYSPAYAIRSYAYLIPYYLATAPLRDLQSLLQARFPAYYYFYAIRVVALGGFTAFAEHRLHRSVKTNYGLHAANWYLLFSTFAPGMSHASVALLPSAFAMTWVTWGSASAISAVSLRNDDSIVRPSIHALGCYMVAGLLGWPFALALAVPFGLFTMQARYQTPPLVKIVPACLAVLVALMAVLLVVDSYFYARPFLFVPINIVLYNVFALEGEGPAIFGVEPLSYYVKNLLLNFNAVFVLGCMGAAVNVVWGGQRLQSAFGVSLPLVIWCGVFGRQAHKEERFLYPVYPMLCLSAAIFTSKVFAAARLKAGARALVRLALVLSMAAYATVSVLRILNLVANYSAPLSTALALHEDAVQHPSEGLKNVCVGREWYHFPTSFFLPDNYRLRFVESGFDGLLPGDFPEHVSLRSAASVYPSGMNARNEFSADKVVPFADCDYYIDNSLDTTAGEPSVLSAAGSELTVHKQWQVLRCEKIIKPDGAHRGVGRLVYVPEVARRVVPYNVEQMDYCVLKRK
ncbi:hypothetical protein METBIDRAFT_38156 [Metschnikowia bicuspidata var. bicuspidata NRRL YB-4993]|uniref:Mannosyltransferase n=1 Tax=Metschnikowia bicuspidata var. bicuspidata NRRL YB-4993 TaxID=869754 RepID=A0A1A0HH71_9ASCO|nr:hypothetical protein METBIDRAFT_38156 [Metschnikowia bicuspidata var. bicuspidata NRRL YB-4993]OBA23188.1 hypothetical protein METBIDRAFT_38156 [Metschnikowia bicuspidata var. bicuspidata NRRL YB-4993]